MKYIICERCGAHLDTGEHCDCEEDDSQEEDEEKEKCKSFQAIQDSLESEE